MATLYLHIPFCKRICSYCDFYKVGATRLLPATVEALHNEMEQRQDYIADRALTSIYFGGGTPSLLHPTDIEALIDHARQLFDCSAVDEITIEANPDDLTDEYVEALARTSVNRVSLGIQSFDDDVLRFMNRRHSAEEAKRAVERLRNANIANISIDLIFGVAGFGREQLLHSLAEATKLDVEHISAYHLTIEERTKLGTMLRKGEYRPLSDEESEEEYLIVHQALEAAGYEHYEVSNYARKGYRAKHNSAYWTGVEYLGLGPGAHSFSRDNRTWCISTAAEYAEGNMRYEDEMLSATDHLNEYVMISLRRAEGIDLGYVEACFGSEERKRIVLAAKPWIECRALIAEGDRLRIAAEKFLVSDAIIESLFA